MTMEFFNLACEHDRFGEDALEGLGLERKRISPKYFYDHRGSELFEKITQVHEYYPTRSEISLLHSSVDEIGRELGPGCTLVEFGSGASRKTRLLLDHLPDLQGYMPIDISRDFLLETSRQLMRDYPRLRISPICADFTRLDRLPQGVAPIPPGRAVGFFPGSTLGNLDAAEADAFLHNAAQCLGPQGRLLLGVDPFKDKMIHEMAYNDTDGVTREFNLNLLRRMNEELGADFDTTAFEHLAFFNPRESRMEMHLRSLKEQTVHLLGREFHFGVDETLHTENCYKYTAVMLDELASRSGFGRVKSWATPRNLFQLLLLEVKEVGVLPRDASGSWAPILEERGSAEAAA